MIKNIKLFVNNNEKSIEVAKLVEKKLYDNGYNIDNDNFNLGIAIGGDGSFLRMIKNSKFNSEPYYVGINTGHLGFLQEVKIEEVDKLIGELKNNKYKVSKIGIQETTVKDGNDEFNFYSLNEIVVRDKNLDILKSDIYINNDFLEAYTGDGIMLATSIGSTAYNISYGGSIVSPEFSTLQLTSMGAINSKVYRTLSNSLILPKKTIVKLVPSNKNLIVSIDGENKEFNNVESISSSIGNKKIKMLRFSHYNFAQKINEKLLSD